MSEDSGGTQSGGGEQRIFLRKASGLIRTASGLDTFIYNFVVLYIML